MPRRVTRAQMLQIFSDRLNQRLRDMVMSQADFARLLGIRRSSMSHYSTGISFPPLWQVYNMADALGVSCDFLLGRREK